MIKYVMIAAIAFGLSACNSQESIDRAESQIQSKLPEGCTIDYLGSYVTKFSVYPVLVTICKNRDTTTNVYRQSHGKTNTDIVSVVIGEKL